MRQVFLLSPARCDGARARLLLNPDAPFELAARVRGDTAGSSTIGEVFSFLSGLYFRGKVAYAAAFARPPHACDPTFIITTDRGLVTPESPVRRDDLVAFSRVDIGRDDARFHTPLRRDAERLADAIGHSTRVVLLGSIATNKYVTPLLAVFGPRLVFPIDFVGRGDMSRGGLLLRCVGENRELAYAPLEGAARHGARPPKLAPIPRRAEVG